MCFVNFTKQTRPPLYGLIINKPPWLPFQQWIKKQTVGRDSHWIGLTDSEQENEWKWLDGTPVDYK